MSDIEFQVGEDVTIYVEQYASNELLGDFRLYDETSIAIASGVLDVPSGSSVIIVQAETGTADDLTDISTKVGIIMLRADSGDTITLKHHGSDTANKIRTREATDLNLTTTGYTILYRKTTSQVWRVIGDGGGASDHGTLTGLSDDDHTIYLLLTGRSGGQTVIGGTAASNNLNLQSTSHGTKGQITVGSGETVTIDDDTGNTYIGGTLDVQGSVQFAGGPFVTSSIVSPAQLTADQNNYNPTGFTAATVVRLTSDASRNITGMVGTSDEIKILQNVGSNNIVLKDESSSSTAANRFALTADVTLSPDSIVILFYDSTSTRWRVLSAGGGGGLDISELFSISGKYPYPTTDEIIAQVALRSRVIWYNPAYSNNVQHIGCPGANSGTPSGQAFVNLNWSRLSSPTGTPSISSQSGNGQFFLARGLYYFDVVYYPDASYNEAGASTGTRISSGMVSTGTSNWFTSDDPAGSRICFVRRHTNGGAQDTNWKLSVKDGTTENLIDTGMPFVAQNIYVRTFGISAGGTTLTWKIWNVTAGGAAASGTTTSNLPAGTTALYAGDWIYSVNSTTRLLQFLVHYAESGFIDLT